jgi:hypothetical protein
MLRADSTRSDTLISFRNSKQSTVRPIEKPKNQPGTGTNKAYAKDIAGKAFLHLAADEQLLSRFLALTGLDPLQLREIAQEPAFLSGVLDFFLGHEPTLVALSEAENIKPEDIARARTILEPNEN